MMAFQRVSLKKLDNQLFIYEKNAEAMASSKDEVDLMKRRALSFLEVAKYSLQRGMYDLAAFNAEQAAQLYLKATLLEKIGDFPRTHSIIFLLNELRRVDEEEVGRFIRENKNGLHNLEDAYFTNYFYKKFDEDDGRYLVSLAEEVIKFCEKLGSGVGKGKNPQGMGKVD